jgi:hypothetical protein
MKESLCERGKLLGEGLTNLNNRLSPLLMITLSLTLPPSAHVATARRGLGGSVFPSRSRTSPTVYMNVALTVGGRHPTTLATRSESPQGLMLPIWSLSRVSGVGCTTLSALLSTTSTSWRRQRRVVDHGVVELLISEKATEDVSLRTPSSTNAGAEASVRPPEPLP